MSAEVWTQIYDRIAALIAAHRTTLIFVNTRRLAERVTRQLSERVGEDQVTAHHGSLAKEQRLDAEQRLKRGALKALVATASLELGIDIGDVDLVCQIGSPRSIASFLQRVGRSGHAVGGTPKGRLYPLSRDELVECAALIDAVRRGELDRLSIPEQPLDVLAQQIVAEVAARDWNEDELYRLIRRAWPFRALPRTDFTAVAHMLAEGFATSRGRRGALIHRDAVNHMLRGRRGARPHRADVRRHYSGHRRLPGDPGTGKPLHRHGERGFRRRKPGRRRFSARQHVVPDHPGRARGGARGGRAWPAAEHSVLARRGAGAQRRVVAIGVASARHDRRSARRRCRGGRRVALAGRDRHRRARRLADRRISRGGARGAGRFAHARNDRVRALLRRSRRDATRHPFALWQPRQPRLGAGAAQTVLPQVQFRAASGGDRRQYRALAYDGAQLRSRRGGALPARRQRARRC